MHARCSKSFPSHPPQRQPSPNVPKAHTATEQHRENPDPTFHPLPGQEAQTYAGRIRDEGVGIDGRVGGTGRGSGCGRGHHVWVGGKEEGGPGGADGAREDEARFRAIDQVPEHGVDEGEGKRCLQC
jgi:hypothetical protein